MSLASLLNTDRPPLILAPLAGVSDFPFRRVCDAYGAQLTYVEMLSAQPIIRRNRRTMDMLEVKRGRNKLGVQITGRDEHEISRAVAIIDACYPYDTIDINMGCPVRKVVSTGCGSALIRDARLVYRIVAAARKATTKPLSLKIRLGWSRSCLNYLEVGRAAEEGGADWITVHGRTRNENYSYRVDLISICKLKETLDIPVIGNGDLFSSLDFAEMRKCTGVDGLMISRGALGNPWIFQGNPADTGNGIKGVRVDKWLDGVLQHLEWQLREYGDTRRAAVCMRKHLLWYLKGWPGACQVKEKVNRLDTIMLAFDLIKSYATGLDDSGVCYRSGRCCGYDFAGRV